MTASGNLPVSGDVYLVPLTRCDSRDYARFYLATHSSLVGSGQAQPGQARELDASTRLSWIQSDVMAGDALGYAIRRKGRAGLFGEVVVSGLRGPSDPEIEYSLEPTERGKGIATESVGAVIQQVFQTSDVEGVVFEIGTGNDPSKKVAKSSGARPVRAATGGERFETWRVARG
ncbi:MAG TPA: GNAT family N-acetyltransferase [Candidatus Saccharimonadales bacterium]|nr:GNAT family N-acetyltransferase [Candidatus Saccharimonadales bacterium]